MVARGVLSAGVWGGVCLEEEYLQKTQTLQLEYEGRWQTLFPLAQKVHADRPASFNMKWLLERRSVQVSIRQMMSTRRQAEEQRDEELLALRQAMREKFPEHLWEAVQFPDFMQESLSRALALRSRQAVDDEVQPGSAVDAPSASSHVVHGAWNRYQKWFCEAAGRKIEDGPPGFDAPQPDLPPGDTLDDGAWARHFMRLGGYGSASQVDENGWTALMHAMQATVHWDIAWRCCEGLIAMMPDERLRAKATGGRMKGYSAFHMACNGSDRALRRSHLVNRLIEPKADLEATNDKGVTPWLLATATGVVDTAMVLSQAGCNVTATTPEGRNAADRCERSSTQMLKYLPPTRHPRTAKTTLAPDTLHTPPPTIHHPPPTTPTHTPLSIIHKVRRGASPGENGHPVHDEMAGGHRHFAVACRALCRAGHVQVSRHARFCRCLVELNMHGLRATRKYSTVVLLVRKNPRGEVQKLVGCSNCGNGVHGGRSGIARFRGRTSSNRGDAWSQVGPEWSFEPSRSRRHGLSHVQCQPKPACQAIYSRRASVEEEWWGGFASDSRHFRGRETCVCMDVTAEHVMAQDIQSDFAHGIRCIC